jgi:hypothetical protein
VSVTVSLYAFSGGAALWTSTQTLKPAHGVMSTRLAAPDTVRFDQPYSPGVKIGSDAEMTPRLPLAVAPYALSLPNVLVDRPSGAVGIGAPPNSDVPLIVGGEVHSTAGGFRFPDGTVHATAQVAGPQGQRARKGRRDRRDRPPRTSFYRLCPALPTRRYTSPSMGDPRRRPWRSRAPSRSRSLSS